MIFHSATRSQTTKYLFFFYFSTIQSSVNHSAKLTQLIPKQRSTKKNMDRMRDNSPHTIADISEKVPSEEVADENSKAFD